MRKDLYSSIFNSSTFLLKKFKYQPTKKYFALSIPVTPEYILFGPKKGGETFTIEALINETTDTSLTSDLLLVDSNTSLINNKKIYFSSVAGNPYEP